MTMDLDKIDAKLKFLFVSVITFFLYSIVAAYLWFVGGWWFVMIIPACCSIWTFVYHYRKLLNPKSNLMPFGNR